MVVGAKRGYKKEDERERFKGFQKGKNSVRWRKKCLAGKAKDSGQSPRRRSGGGEKKLEESTVSLKPAYPWIIT